MAECGATLVIGGEGRSIGPDQLLSGGWCVAAAVVVRLKIEICGNLWRSFEKIVNAELARVSGQVPRCILLADKHKWHVKVSAFKMAAASLERGS